MDFEKISNDIKKYVNTAVNNDNAVKYVKLVVIFVPNKPLQTDVEIWFNDKESMLDFDLGVFKDDLKDYIKTVNNIDIDLVRKQVSMFS